MFAAIYLGVFVIHVFCDLAAGLVLLGGDRAEERREHVWRNRRRPAPRRAWARPVTARAKRPGLRPPAAALGGWWPCSRAWGRRPVLCSACRISGTEADILGPRAGAGGRATA